MIPLVQDDEIRQWVMEGVPLWEIEKRVLKRVWHVALTTALQRSDHDRKVAADALQCSVRALDYKMIDGNVKRRVALPRPRVIRIGSRFTANHETSRPS